MKTLKSILPFVILAFVYAKCGDKPGPNPDPPTPNPPTTGGPDIAVNSWLTTGDKTSLLKKQAAAALKDGSASGNVITVDSTQKFQGIDGFGYTLTGGSAMLMQKMSATSRAALIKNLFGNGDEDIRVNYIRLSIAASDLNENVFSYDDMPAGQTDPTLAKFTLGEDLKTVVPTLKEILAINPSIKIQATPWSAPPWMKDNKSYKGGSLLAEYQQVYADYFVKYIKSMKEHGITIDAVTPQNEPLHPGNNPSMYMKWEQQADFIKNNLGPAFEKNNITTKIIVYDHNLDHPEYATNILKDADAAKYVNGSAFHLYAGDINVMGQVHDAYPNKALYFTEQYTSSTSAFEGDLKWHLKNVIIGSVRNWSRIALQWNLANDPNFKPFTPDGGCSVCKGAVTISGNDYSFNAPYYVVAHASKFVPDGAVRISSTEAGNIATAAFLAPDGKKILIALNNGDAQSSFTIKYKTKVLSATLPAGAVSTFVW